MCLFLCCVCSFGFPKYLRAHDPAYSEKDKYAGTLLARAGVARVSVLEVFAVGSRCVLSLYGNVHNGWVSNGKLVDAFDMRCV